MYVRLQEKAQGKIRQKVRNIKDHPSLLHIGVGNSQFKIKKKEVCMKLTRQYRNKIIHLKNTRGNSSLLTI